MYDARTILNLVPRLFDERNVWERGRGDVRVARAYGTPSVTKMRNFIEGQQEGFLSLHTLRTGWYIYVINK